MNEASSAHEPEPRKPRWQPLSAIDRRVAGVLVEKAKTTPEAYPMSLNAITTACNQKSNRAPVMQLEPDVVAESLDRLRESGAVGLIEGQGRVAKYRHYLYEWLGADKVELAVMAELLLRGDQTEGELRVRASRMEPLPDLAALRTVLDSLVAKGLVVPLTPQGRGHVVTHALYRPQELERLKAQYAGRAPLADPPEVEASMSVAPAPFAATVPPPAGAAAAAGAEGIGELRDQLSQLRADVDSLTEQFQRLVDDFHEFKRDLGA